MFELAIVGPSDHVLDGKPGQILEGRIQRIPGLGVVLRYPGELDQGLQLRRYFFQPGVAVGLIAGALGQRDVDEGVTVAE